DGIRDATVTGVQTCALPICPELQLDWKGRDAENRRGRHHVLLSPPAPKQRRDAIPRLDVVRVGRDPIGWLGVGCWFGEALGARRSEGRRGGEGCGARWSRVR